jgi:hypothetical protein
MNTHFGQRRNDLSKNRELKRRRKRQKRRSVREATPALQRARDRNGPVVSAQTMWRTMHVDFSVQEELVATALRVQPSLWQRDAEKIKRIEQVSDVEAVLDLAPTATGMADYAWLKRMRGFGPSGADAIAERLTGGWLGKFPKAQTGIQERCIGALRWCDNENADALMRCWDAFDDYGRSLGCILVGLLDVRPEADRLWKNFQRVRTQPNLYFVGPLWGLIDVQDPRAADALAELIAERRTFYELYGFISRAGDARFIVPLVEEVLKKSEQTSADAMWALTGVAHRLGRDGLLRLLSDGAGDATRAQVETFVDRILRYDQDAVERYFETLYARTSSREVV